MGTALILAGPREILLEDYPEPPLDPGSVRVQTLYSGISAGTELAQYRGTTPHVRRAWDVSRRLFTGDPRPRGYPITAWGYEEVGRVIEVGAAVHSVAVGETVWGAWGHRSTAVLPEADAARRVLPGGLEAPAGVFARIGAVALNGILDAGINVGETVAVFGVGVVGLLVVQLARLAGAGVVAVDRSDRRLETAARLGAEAVLRAADGAAMAEELRARTSGRGADVCIEATGVPAALHEAIRAVAYAGTVVALGFFQGDASALRLGEEFHHNRVTIVSSQISSVAPRLSHRWDRPRLETTVMGLAASGRLRLRELISHIIPVAQAAEAYEMLDRRPDDTLQVILEF